MKKLEELGISPWPWTMNRWFPFVGIESKHHTVGIVSVGKIGNEADAPIVAAAPELYKCLFDIVKSYNDCKPMSVVPNLIKRAEKILAKAAVEKVSKL